MRNTRENILKVAGRLFGERGYDNVTLRDIAAECGISSGNLSYHFRKKEDLVVALLSGPYDAIIGQYQNGECRSVAELMASFDKVRDEGRRYQYYFQNLGTLTAQSEFVREREICVKKASSEFYQRSFKSLIAGGSLRDDIPWEHYQNICYILALTSIAWYTDGDSPDYSDSLEGLFEALCSIAYPCLSREGVREWDRQMAARGRRAQDGLAS